MTLIPLDTFMTLTPLSTQTTLITLMTLIPLSTQTALITLMTLTPLSTQTTLITLMTLIPLVTSIHVIFLNPNQSSANHSFSQANRGWIFRQVGWNLAFGSWPTH
jgi:hypothetical protein